MKRVIQWLALAVMACSVSSCGLPGALVRSAGNLVNSATSMVGSAAGY